MDLLSIKHTLLNAKKKSSKTRKRKLTAVKRSVDLLPMNIFDRSSSTGRSADK